MTGQLESHGLKQTLIQRRGCPWHQDRDGPVRPNPSVRQTFCTNTYTNIFRILGQGPNTGRKGHGRQVPYPCARTRPHRTLRDPSPHPQGGTPAGPATGKGSSPHHSCHHAKAPDAGATETVPAACQRLTFPGGVDRAVQQVSSLAHPTRTRRGQDKTLQFTHQPTRHQGGNGPSRAEARMPTRGQARPWEKTNSVSPQSSGQGTQGTDQSNGQGRSDRCGVLRRPDHCV